ncbi:MAG: S8 family serine peptidase [Patescibacteria group bacterium]|jgi:subtilisin family serine protease
MKKKYLVFLFGAVFILCVSILLADKPIVFGQNEDNLVKINSINKASYKKGELIVKFKKNIFAKNAIELGNVSISPKKVKDESIKKLNSKIGVEKIVKLYKTKNKNISESGSVSIVKPKGVKSVNLKNLYKIVFPKKTNITDAVNQYNANSNVLYAEPNYKTEIMLTPNDPYYSSFGSWGQDFFDMYGLYNISAGNAWNQTIGSSNVTVAVIDTGLDYNHSDIADNVWINTDEISNNGIDDDNNGYIDDYRGYDFVNNDADPIDDYGHGTHCSGTIAAVTNNEVGVAGVSWSSKIMPVKFLNSSGSGYYSDAILAIQYSVDNGAQILSNSWGGYGSSQGLQDAINYAYSNGAIFVAAAGNSNWDASYFQPAGMDNVLTVSAVDYNETKASFSNYGDEVDVAAPGVNILSLRASGTTMGSVVGSNYTIASGTSMATPHVAGLAALILAAHPTMSNQEIENNIKNYADDKGATGFDIYYGYGRINAEQAVLAAPVSLSSDFSTISALPTRVSVNSSASITVTVKNVYNVVVAGKKVILTTNFGTLSKTSGYTNSLGQLSVDLTSSLAGTARVEASVNGQSLGNTNIEFITTNDITPPAKVDNFTAKAGSKSVTLYWTNPDDVDLAGIIIRRKTGGYPINKTDGHLVSQGLKSSVTDNGLENKQTYYYVAFAYDTNNNYSEASFAKAKPMKKKGSDSIPPTPVRKLKLAQVDGKVRITWKNPINSDFSGVLIKRSENGFPVLPKQGDKIYRGIGEKVGNSNLRKAADKSVSKNKVYYYSIFAFDDASNYSLFRSKLIFVK